MYVTGSQSSSLRTKAITAPNLKYYIPTTTQRHIKNYMKTSPFSAEADTIPLWNPSPTQHDHIERWGKNVYIGDVGLFNEDGGFDTLFNIFETEDENISRGLNPPKGFVPYFKKLSETLKTNLIFSRAKKNLYIRGFNKDKRKESDDRPRIRIPDSLRSKPDRVYCSAMHLSQGFLRLKIGQFERAHISEYVEKYQETWRPHLEENALDETRARSFVIIVASFRAQSWALATATKPRLSSRKGKATLRTVSGIPDMSFWESDDDDILTNSGPSDLDIKEMQSYLQTISNKKDREEIEWCHCVAVQADFLEDEMEASRRGSSRNSSRTTIRP
ncbi:hypothetical protein BDZ97DRAFT_1781278 [Flammula alnicola]|nr:hypothetical protein BDZ97DRAFT_1781278 [Flammula alnicola]